MISGPKTLVRLRAASWAMRLLGIVALLSAEATRADVERVPEKERSGPPAEGDDAAKDPPEAPDAVPAPSPEAAGKDGSPGDDSRADLVGDALFQRLRVRLEEWRRSGREVRSGGVRAHAWIAPDTIAYQTAKHYLAWRREGLSPEATREKLRTLARRWTRYEETSALIVTLDNELYEAPAAAADAVDLVTQSESLSRSAFVLQDAQDRRIALRLSGRPLNLREAKLRVRRFWVLSDARTGGGARSPGGGRAGPIVGGPTFAPRKAMLSKPFEAVLLEDEPAEVELIAPRRAFAVEDQSWRLELKSWKRYRGPFEDLQLDLNEGRTWEEIPGLELPLSLPPRGLEVDPELTLLVEEIRAPR